MTKFFMGKEVRIDRGGPESRVGKLLDVFDDHLVLLTKEDGVVYYNTSHIKSVTVNSKEQRETNTDIPMDFEYKKAESFHSLLDNLKLQWVKINRGGPEKIEGIIYAANKDFVSLINNDELVHISLSHIRNISKGVKPENANDEKSKQQHQDSQEKMSRSKSNLEKANDKKSENKNQDSQEKMSQSKSILDKANDKKSDTLFFS
jgi:spore coat protein B